MSDETTLLSCPFCKGEAKLMHMDLDSIEEGWQVWGVWCVPDLNAEYSHGHYIDNYATAEEAIEAWNTRAPLGSDREAALEALAKDLYENAVDFNFKGWIPYYRGRFAALGIEVEQ